MNSRSWKSWLCAAALACATACASHSADEPAEVPRPVDHANLLNYADHTGQQRPVATAQDWAVRRGQILHGMQEAMGKLPDRSSLPQLDVQVRSEVECCGVRRQTLTFASGDGDRVAAYLFLPVATAATKLPAVLALHQTATEGKDNAVGSGSDRRMTYGTELAERGYVVLAPDYPSFGESQNYDFQADRYISGTMKGIWNHMRAVDLLAARDEIDPARIGVIGHSLGGHNAMFVGCFDERLKVIVSSCGWTPFHDYYGGKIAGWTSDRYMPRLRDAYGLDPDRVPFDFYEVVAALAPRAFFSNSPVGDENFAVAGVKKAESAAADIFKLLGAPNNLQVRYPECGHSFPPEVRREAYQFIDRVLQHKPVKEVP